ncbi:uncharacterized membrane protein YhaH (DUF805 family) [Tunturiibacter psychrotolerans]
MTTTRYSLGNVVLLIVGTLVCLFITFLLIMTGGFGADPVHDFQSLAVTSLLVVGLLSCPTYLLMFRWRKVGATGMWCVAISCAVIALIGGLVMQLLGLVALLMVEASICEAINSGSKTHELPYGRS